MQTRAQRQPTTLTADDARRIIVQDDAQLLIERAREMAQSSNATRTSVRRLFGEVRRIDILWGQQPELARRRAILLEPRFAYQASRDTKLKDLERGFTILLHEVNGDQSRFQRFADFFEAVIAYMARE